MADLLHVYTIKKPDGTVVTVQAPSVGKAAAAVGTTPFESTIKRADIGCVKPPKADIPWSGDVHYTPPTTISPVTPGIPEGATPPEGIAPEVAPPKVTPDRRHREPEVTALPEIKPVDTRKYTITLPSGKTKTFDTVTYDEAVLRAKQWEAAEGSLKDIGVGVPLSAFVVRESLRGAATASPMSYARARVKYGIEPEGSVAIRTGTRPSDVGIIPPEQVDAIKLLPFYLKAKGTEEKRLSSAYQKYLAVPQKDLGNKQSISLDSIKDEQGNILMMGWNDISEKWQKVGLADGLTAMVNAIFNARVAAEDQLREAGFRCGDAKEGEDFTFAGLVDYVNKNPKGLQTLEDYGFPQDALDTVADFEAKIESGEIIPVPGGDYITKEKFDEQPTGAQQILKEGGFAALEAATAMIWEKGDRPIGAKGDPRFARRLAEWEALTERIDQEKFRELSISERNWYRPALGYNKRALALLASAFIRPIKATLPEYTMADIAALDWVMSIANVGMIVMGVAPGVLTGSAVGRAVITALSGTLGGMVGYETAQHWSELTPAQRAIGVGITALCAIPVLTTAARGIKITSTAIPTRAGAITTWKGLKVAGYPIIGKSGGRWVLGTRNITLPEARLILNGYKPEMMLETKVFVNRTALTKAGFSKTQVDYLIKTLKARNLFAGKVSPWLDAKVMIEPTQRLNAKEIDIIMKRLIKASGKVKEATMVYGSPTIKAQAAPGLRGWRSLHDWDIALTMSEAEVKKFTRQLLAELKAGGGGIYRISPKSPTLIEKKIGGVWQHIADIHAYEISSQIPVSRLDATGQYSYGRMVSEPALTVKYPGVGELQIMRLSESGIRKADTILRVRQTVTGTAFRPPQRGIAQPGVPKDAADFYVIARTFLGEDIAEDWLRAWAKAMGYADSQLAKVLPNIRKAMLEVAANTPSNIIGYRFIPAASTKVASGAAPYITVSIPSSLGASISSSLAGRISQPIYPYKLARSPSMQASASAALVSVASKFPSAFPSPGVGRVSPVSIPSVSVSPSPSVSGMPSLSPSISVKVSPSPRGLPSPTPAPPPSAPPSAPPSPPPSAPPSPAPRRKPILRLVTVGGKDHYKIPVGSIAWRQGAVWKFIPPPWGNEKPITLKEAPIGAKHIGSRTPQKTIQMIGKSKAKVPKDVSIDLGIADIKIDNYGTGISFTGKGEETIAGERISETTKGMSIPAISPTKIRGKDTDYRKLAFGTSLRSLTKETYNTDRIPKKFADRVLSSKLGKMTPKEIAAEIKDSGVASTRKVEILKMLPDRVRDQIEMWLATQVEYAPTRGFPKALYLPQPFRRKKKVLRKSPVPSSVVVR